ncbi:hypothetical protein BC940DRAFT_347812 [Gongronella butleri]|nr:hypothetical protein BC940DRAFT_347812 [Gongronella butleri]
MDDLYQYTSSAVNDDNKQNEQDDPLIKAFTSFGWGQRFNSLMDTVKKQSEAFVDVTKKDLQEFANVLRDDSTEIVEQLSQSTTSDQTVTASSARGAGDADTDEQGSGMSFTALREGLGRINPMNLTSLREGLTDTLGQLPAQLSSTVKLPDNLKLSDLQRELDQGTKFAEQYLQTFGSDVLTALQRTVTVLEPEDDDVPEGSRNAMPKAASRIFATRKEALLADMQTNQHTFLDDPRANASDSDEKLLDTFVSGFHIDEYTEEIARLLENTPELRATMDELGNRDDVHENVHVQSYFFLFSVPVQVDYTTFWQRYFYHAWKIDQEEQKRQLIAKGADNDDDDFKWDSDDDELAEASGGKASKAAAATMATTRAAGKEKQPMLAHDDAHDTSKSDTDFSNISGPPSTEASLVSPPLKSQNDTEEWVKPKAQNAGHDDDSDSDWE